MTIAAAKGELNSRTADRLMHGNTTCDNNDMSEQFTGKPMVFVMKYQSLILIVQILSSYKRLLRATNKSFAGDEVAMATIKNQIRHQFDESKNIKDPLEIDQVCAYNRLQWIKIIPLTLVVFKGG